MNKVNTKVVLRLPVGTLPVDEDTRARVRHRLGSRITGDDELIIRSSETRSQSRNRELAEERALDMLTAAMRRPRSRRPTRKPAAAEQRRLERKKRRGERKRQRRDPDYLT